MRDERLTRLINSWAMLGRSVSEGESRAATAAANSSNRFSGPLSSSSSSSSGHISASDRKATASLWTAILSPLGKEVRLTNTGSIFVGSDSMSGPASEAWRLFFSNEYVKAAYKGALVVRSFSVASERILTASLMLLSLPTPGTVGHGRAGQGREGQGRAGVDKERFAWWVGWVRVSGGERVGSGRAGWGWVFVGGCGRGRA